MRLNNEPRPSVRIDDNGRELHRLHHAHIRGLHISKVAKPGEPQPSCVTPAGVVRPTTIRTLRDKGYLEQKGQGDGRYLVLSKMGKYAIKNIERIGGGPTDAELKKQIEADKKAILRDRRERGLRADGGVDKRRSA